MNPAAAVRLFEASVLGDLFPGAKSVVYHQGEMARDKLTNPALAAVAQRALELSTGHFVVVSKCGHPRSEFDGTGEVVLVTQRDRGGVAYVAVRR